MRANPDDGTMHKTVLENMMTSTQHARRGANRLLAATAMSTAVAALFVTMPAHALYKVVGPDGKITYTDQPNVSTQNKVQTVSGNGSVANDAGALPYELRQAVSRYPVTVFVATDCSPCDAGKQLLRQRGIPYTEKVISTNEDGEALKRITGESRLPALTVGAQIVRGWQSEEWTSYLDAAGYPKQSQLPPTFPQVRSEPMTQSTRAPAAPAPAPRAPAPAPAPVEAPPPPSGIRF